MKSGKVTMVTVGNKRTADGEDNNLTPCQEFLLAIDDAINKFKGVFYIAAVVELDCNKPSSKSMMDFRSQIKQIRGSCIENADKVPKVCERLKFLIFTVINGKPDSTRLLKGEELGQLLTDYLERPLPDEVSVPKIASYLHDTGAIVYFPNVNMVCLRPSVLVANLIGPLLSSPNVFPISAVDSGSGRATKFEMKTALDRFKKKQSSEGNPTATFTIEEGIRIMLDLGLCCKVQDAEDVYYIPSLIEDTKPIGVWEKTPELTFYRGRRYQVSNVVTDIVPPPMFCVLQSRCSDLHDYCVTLWKDGLKLESHSDTAECLVELSSTRRKSIDVVLRCDEVDKAAAKITWEKVKEVIEAVRDKRAPGTSMGWCYLSSKDLQEHTENEDVAVYEKSNIENSDRIRAKRKKDGRHPLIQVKDLLFPVVRGEESAPFPDDEALEAEKAFFPGCSEDKDDVEEENVLGLDDQVVEVRHIDFLKYEVIENVDDLRDFARHLLDWSSSRVNQNLYDMAGRSTSAKFFDIVKTWIDDKGINATVPELLKAFEKIGKEGKARKVLSQCK